MYITEILVIEDALVDVPLREDDRGPEVRGEAPEPRDRLEGVQRRHRRRRQPGLRTPVNNFE